MFVFEKKNQTFDPNYNYFNLPFKRWGRIIHDNPGKLPKFNRINDEAQITTKYSRNNGINIMGYRIVFLLKFILFFPYQLLIKGENHLHEK